MIGMKQKLTSTIMVLGILFLSNTLQAATGVVDFLSSIGKMYSVVAIIVVIFLGIVLFLWRMDKRIDKIENHINNGK